MTDVTAEQIADHEAFISESQARIRQLLADAELKFAQIQLSAADTEKRRQDILYAPYTLIFTGMGATTAVFAAAFALLKWIH